MKRLCTTSCLVSPQMVFLLKFGGELTSCITVLRTIGIPFLGNIHVWQFPALCRHYLCLVVQQNFAYIYTSAIYLLVIIYSRYLEHYYFLIIIFHQAIPMYAATIAIATSLLPYASTTSDPNYSSLQLYRKPFLFIFDQI